MELKGNDEWSVFVDSEFGADIVETCTYYTTQRPLSKYTMCVYVCLCIDQTL